MTLSPTAADHTRHYLEVLRTISTEVAIGGTPGERLSWLVELVARELRWDVCSIYVLEESELVLAATHGLDRKSVGKARLPVSEGLVGAAARDEKPLFLTVAADDARFRYVPGTGEEKYTSMAAAPLMRGGKVLGVVTVQTALPYDFTTADRHFLEILAGQIAQAADLALSMRTLRSPSVSGVYGTPVSPGIAEARVHLFAESPDRITVAARGFRGLEFENGLFDEALKEALSEINQLIDQMNRVSSPAAQIFVAHRMILEDPDFSRRVHDNIRERQESAPRAVAFIMDGYIEKFSAIENELLREKTQDIKDLRDTLLRLMMDKKITHFAPEFEEENMVVIARELTPQQIFRLDTGKVVALVTEQGSELSHVAILARALKLPAVVGVKGIVEDLKPEDRVLVDGSSGYVFVNPDADLKKTYFEKRQALARRQVAIEENIAATSEERNRLCDAVTLDANIGLPFEIDEAVGKKLESVGLFRTEFFYMQQRSWPDEELQARFYERLLKAFPSGGVTIRLLDIGGDKFLTYMPEMKEENPHLGFRSVRLLLDHPEILQSQLRAIHIAAQRTRTIPRILVPMVTHPWELIAVRESLMEVTQGKMYPLGIMIEVPGALFQIDELTAEADFISIGTNDLTQYLLAVDRNNPRVTHLSPPLHPAVLRALDFLFQALSRLTKRFSICGEMAGDPVTALALLVLGYRNLTVAPSRVLEMAYLLRCIPEELLASMREPLLKINDATISEKILRLALKEHAPLLS